MFTQESFSAAIRLAKDARHAYKAGLIGPRELRDRFNTIRYLIGEPEMNQKHFEWLLEGLND